MTFGKGKNLASRIAFERKDLKNQIKQETEDENSSFQSSEILSQSQTISSRSKADSEYVKAQKIKADKSVFERR